MTENPHPSAAEHDSDPQMGQARGLWNRDHVLLWQGQLVSQIGNQAYLVALMFWTLEATGSASIMGLLLMTSALPGVLIGPIAGAVVDRHSRKAIIVGSDVARGVATLAVAALVGWRTESTGFVLCGLFALSLFSGMVGSLFRPAIAAAIPDLVSRDHVQAANSLNQTSVQSAAVLGQVLGGVLYRALGAPLLFMMDGVSYLVSGASECLIRLPRAPKPAPRVRGALREYVSQTRDGFEYVWVRSGLKTFIVTAAALNFFFMPIFVLLPFYVTTQLGQGPAWYGFLLAAMSAGSLVGIALAGMLPAVAQRRAQPIIPALIVVSLLMATLGSVSQPGLALVWTFGLGALTGLINIIVITQVQLTTPAHLRGRVLALLFALTGAATPFGMALGGVAGDLIGQNIPLLYGSVGAAATLVVLSAVSQPAFRAFIAEGSAHDGSA